MIAKTKCPWCGNDEIEYQTSTEDREGIPVNPVCCHCGACGPYDYVNPNSTNEDFEHYALQLWDNRPE